MYSDAIRLAKKILDIHNHFQNNKHLLNEVDGYALKHSITYKTIYSTANHYIQRNMNEYDTQYKFLLHLKGTELVEFTSTECFIHMFTPEQFENCSTEEGYFQISTLHSEEIVDALVVIDYLNKSGCDSFYLDTEVLDVLYSEIFGC